MSDNQTEKSASSKEGFELEYHKYINHDQLENLFQKYLDGYKIVPQQIMLTVKGLSRFRPDGLYGKVTDYVMELWKKQLYLSNKQY